MEVDSTFFLFFFCANFVRIDFPIKSRLISINFRVWNFQFHFNQKLFRVSAGECTVVPSHGHEITGKCCTDGLKSFSAKSLIRCCTTPYTEACKCKWKFSTLLKPRVRNSTRVMTIYTRRWRWWCWWQKWNFTARHNEMQFIYTFFSKSKLASIYLARVSDCSCWCKWKGFISLSTFECGAASCRMNEGDFWNNLDSFVEQQNVGKENEKVGDWLNSVPEAADEKPEQKATSKSKSPSG